MSGIGVLGHLLNVTALLVLVARFRQRRSRGGFPLLQLMHLLCPLDIVYNFLCISSNLTDDFSEGLSAVPCTPTRKYALGESEFVFSL